MAITSAPSNKGGPAARQGFKYQDHVAVSFILKMLRDSTYLQIECETADDIVVVSRPDTELIYEYIQVKTTEGDSKWNLTEITTLDKGKPDSSLLQKSLKCDKRAGIAHFRIVSKRDISKPLQCFLIDINKRVFPDGCTERGAKLAKKFSKTVSDQQRDFKYWADNFVWQVCGEVAWLEAMNIRVLSELAEQHGVTPSHRQQKEIYEHFLNWADDAATADVKTQSKMKIIEREEALGRLSKLLYAAEASSSLTAKPYRSKPEPFLVEFHSVAETNLLRSFAGFDVEYDFDQWRCRELAEHLVEWLPEFCLRASEIANFQVHHAKTVLVKSIGTFTQAKMPRDKLIAELILHTILRSRKESEPIACKVFYESNGKLSEFGNAHIVHQAGEADQLWLGLSKMIPAGTMDDTLKEICAVLDATISKAVLSSEREIIITLREPHHHLPTAEQFSKALNRNSPAQEMLRVMCFPILLAYDSDVLGKGYVSDYIDHLKNEIIDHYTALISKLPPKVIQVKIAIFLLPIESIQSLITEFNSLCKAEN
ncbi:hypothetical protein AXW37_03860 [Yersinia ruckeri]|uniref:HamA C-terminal domain-containing protein n=1 Tax=Yersinia ruckeri TaxID=29486 RepID=UPI0008FD8440|nr:dsDNA nuclease domain-containing protein [Yersinia ruckeri]MCW6525140.1 dsDNA nuclease domain-containing protein [Yersinia ruckeri]MCW6605608.1 dsDNA nuclease domain-containing protein [Yersinia ruckeri]MDN0091853.1 dsDNA nuclease domain-containing protein [Yersinia ruckeri]OIX44727.1 hypothetical protein AXW22_03855 [Yersinia ruckeri]OJB72794.1 hypothetical protein A9Q65_03840 [Yersinia ruckeri]